MNDIKKVYLILKLSPAIMVLFIIALVLLIADGSPLEPSAIIKTRAIIKNTIISGANARNL